MTDRKSRNGHGDSWDGTDGMTKQADKNDKREKSKSLETYKRQVLALFSQTETAKEYFEKFSKDKHRYYRDNLQYILKHFKDYQEDIKQETLLFCIENKIYNAKYLIKIL